MRSYAVAEILIMSPNTYWLALMARSDLPTEVSFESIGYAGHERRLACCSSTMPLDLSSIQTPREPCLARQAWAYDSHCWNTVCSHVSRSDPSIWVISQPSTTKGCPTCCDRAK